jgi:hypothetical protein
MEICSGQGQDLVEQSMVMEPVFFAEQGKEEDNGDPSL